MVRIISLIELLVVDFRDTTGMTVYYNMTGWSQLSAAVIRRLDDAIRRQSGR